MMRPSLPGRIAGKPIMALLIFSFCVCVVMAWYQGHLAWWHAVIAVGIIKYTITALGALRRYKAWEAEWNAMGAPLSDNEPQPIPKHQRSALVVGIAALLTVAPIFLPDSVYTPMRDLLAPLAGLAFCYLLFVLARFLMQRAGLRRAAGRDAAEIKKSNAPVTWLVQRASVSPSRLEAVNNLREYSALLTRVGGAKQDGFETLENAASASNYE